MVALELPHPGCLYLVAILTMEEIGVIQSPVKYFLLDPVRFILFKPHGVVCLFFSPGKSVTLTLMVLTKTKQTGCWDLIKNSKCPSFYLEADSNINMRVTIFLLLLMIFTIIILAHIVT